MMVDRDELYQRIARLWYHWAENHGQVPVWPPRLGSQTHYMAMTAVEMAVGQANKAEAEVIEDVVTFLRMQQRSYGPGQQNALITRLAAALEDGSWESM